MRGAGEGVVRYQEKCIALSDVYEVFVCVGFLSVVSNFYWTFKKENVDITFRLFTLTSQRV